MGFDLAGKVVVITGASSGIGAAAAQAYAKAGAKLVLAARRAERIEALAKSLQDSGKEAIAVRCDVTRHGDLERLMASAEKRFGGIDVLVNNAGRGLYGYLEDVKDDELRSLMELNVLAPLEAIRLALPLLRRRGGGQIVNVSSVLGKRALPGMGAYSATKFAMNGLSEALRLELAKDHIDVIVICPGMTATEFRASAVKSGPFEEPPPPSRMLMSAESVAEAMVRASRRRTREVVLSANGRALVQINRLSPALADRVAARIVPARAAGAR